MTINKIHLNKLLKLFYLPEKELKSELGKDIRAENRKARGEKGGGGDFYGSFWSDAKKHILGELDITEATLNRIEGNYRRRNLYPRLEAGFLELWNRGNNQDVRLLDFKVKGVHKIEECELTIKIENLIALSIDGKERIVYPYWFPDPALSLDSVRLGLWVIKKALPNLILENVRFYDIIHAEYFSLSDAPLIGNEEDLLIEKFREMQSVRKELLK
ncbi:MAG: hypothetical protein COB24_15150 [Hyphomicrobiales bacterium]|nr:MAG: hypothetical protein COB24_15150 [Hyphomicrobiales bacterium]